MWKLSERKCHFVPARDLVKAEPLQLHMTKNNFFGFSWRMKVYKDIIAKIEAVCIIHSATTLFNVLPTV